MAQGPSDDLPDEIEESRPEEGPILSPEELDITESEYVEEIDEGRFVVSPNKRPPQPDLPADTGDPEPAGGYQPAEDTATPTETPEPTEPTPEASGQRSAASHTTEPAAELTLSDVHRWLREDFEQNDSRYAFDVTATFDDSVSQRRMASNDVVTIFESLMLWYAQQVDSNTPVEEILGILLMESNVPVRYPPKSVHKLIKSNDLSPDDEIADLLRAVQDEDGVQL